MIPLASRGQDEEKALDDAISEQIKNVCASLGFPSDKPDLIEEREIRKLLKSICKHVTLWLGLNEQGVAYQVNLAEAPAAVTWKEFDSFLQVWGRTETTQTAKEWIASHAQHGGRSESEVYREVLNAAIQRYAKILHQADNVFVESDKPPLVAQANSLLALLQSLVFDLGNITTTEKMIGKAELDLIVEKWASFSGSGMAVHKDFWPRNEEFILALFNKWAPDVMPIIEPLDPYTGILQRRFEGPSARDLHKKLSDVAFPKLGRQIIASFRTPGAIDRLIQRQEHSFTARCMIWDPKGALWGLLRKELFQVLAEAPSNRAVQANAYELLHWIVLSRDGHVHDDARAMQSLFFRSDRI